MKERWADIPGWTGYEASTCGRVRSHRSGRTHILTQSLTSNGYRRLLISPGRGEPRRQQRVHRLVLLAFVGPCPPGLEVRHLDGDRTNNTLENLRYGTRSENRLDASRHGTHNWLKQNRLAS